MLAIDKRFLNIIVIIFLTIFTFAWSFLVFHKPFNWQIIVIVVVIRIVASIVLFNDYSLSWSKVTQKTFILKSLVYMVAFCVYAPFFYGRFFLYFLFSELFVFLFAINFSMYAYYWLINRSVAKKQKSLVIYGAGKAGLKLEEEFRNTKYKLKYFVDDDKRLQKRSIDSIKILSKEDLKKRIRQQKYDLLLIAIPSASAKRIRIIYERLKPFFHEIKILPSLDKILSNIILSQQLKKLSVEDLLARHPKDLDKVKIEHFIKDRVVMISGAGGSIGSELVRQCLKYGAQKIILIDHSEFNLYVLLEELQNEKLIPVMQNVLNASLIEQSIRIHRPSLFIHAAAYKHVPLVEQNIDEAIRNNILGTKNCIDACVKHCVEKFILISTDKAVRPTNVMGATKRVCELYAQNVDTQQTQIVAVRFGNVLGSSGSVIPKFKEQIQNGGPITVTHPEVTRYFMLISEACELVLQAGAIGKNGELFILDMGQPVKIIDLAKKMIELSEKNDIEIVFTGLRPGEKLYEELLINEREQKTFYESIMIARKIDYPIETLEKDLETLFICKDKIVALQHIVPEFKHQSKGNKS